ncbi:hypothetical protein RA24_12490 [Leisingera sp. ANG-M6]|nr:hypothetical protein RA24_12490 [Leisingera sp. ANG-M6]
MGHFSSWENHGIARSTPDLSVQIIGGAAKDHTFLIIRPIIAQVNEEIYITADAVDMPTKRYVY